MRLLQPKVWMTGVALLTAAALLGGCKRAAPPPARGGRGNPGEHTGRRAGVDFERRRIPLWRLAEIGSAR